MQTRDLLSSIFFLFIAIFFFLGSMKYEIWGAYGPGPGFFPLILTLFLFILSAILFLDKLKKNKHSKSDGAGRVDAPDFSDMKKVALYLFFVFLFYFLFEPLGYLLTVLLFLFLVFKFQGKTKWLASILIPILTACFILFVFVNLLGVTFPEGILKDIYYKLTEFAKNV